MLRIFLLFVLLLASPLMAQAQTKAEIDGLQKKLVALAGQLRSGEEKLAKLADKQAKLDARITDAHTQIDESREEIDGLLQSLIRLSRTPPEAVIAMPGDLRHTLQAAQLMTSLTERLQTKTAQLSHTLKVLKASELELAETRASLQQQQQKLVASQKALAEKLEQRKTAYQLNNKAYEKRVKEVTNIRKSSRDVKQLVSKLDTKSEPKWPKSKTSAARETAAFGKRTGHLHLPVAGYIKTRYGQKEGPDQTSHGYHIASAAGATVVSPSSGEVMFTGPFLDYGNIVILRYDSGYHLLLAGLERIDCSVGQRIITGEPVGRLKAGQSSKADLYMELRKNGKPVDPSPWFG